MSKINSFQLLGLSIVAFVAPACSLAPPKLGSGSFGGSSGMTSCSNQDAGLAAVDSSVIATGDVENVITPQACTTNPTATATNPNAIDRYSQGYGYNDPMILAQVNDTLSGMTVHDEAVQMRGQPYLINGGVQFFDIQSSQDTASIRGFRYRDA